MSAHANLGGVTPEELTDALTRACSEAASRLPGFEAQGPDDYDPLPELHLYAEVGSAVPLAALEAMGMADEFEEGDEIGLQAFPVDALTAPRFQAAGLTSRLEEALDLLRTLLRPELLALIADDTTPEKTRSLASSVAQQLDIEQPLPDYWADVALRPLRAWLTSPDAKSAEDHDLEVRQLGAIAVKGGHLAAFDPGILREDDPPFATAIPDGRYPVLAAFRGSDLQAVVVRLRDVPVAALEPALRTGQSRSQVGYRDRTGHPVDCGVSCITDRRGRDALLALREGGEDLGEWLVRTCRSASLDHERAALVGIGTGAGEPNAVLYTSGADGFDMSLWGLDSGGRTVAFIGVPP